MRKSPEKRSKVPSSASGPRRTRERRESPSCSSSADAPAAAYPQGMAAGLVPLPCEVRSVGALLLPANSRPRQPNMIAGSIEDLGFFGAVLVQESTGRIIAGEHRWRAAKLARRSRSRQVHGARQPNDDLAGKSCCRTTSTRGSRRGTRMR